MVQRSTRHASQGAAPSAELRIVPLTPDRLPDLATLFGQGGDPKWCWCSYFRVRGGSPARREDRMAGNRAVLEAATMALTAEGRAPGLLAYREAEAVGWVSLGPREDYRRLEHSTLLRRIDERPVWSIVCFVVGRRERGRGMAQALLNAAVDYARQHGATLLEAYPTDTGGRRVPAASAYTGTVSMFERAGFTVVARRRYNATTPIRPIVRRAIRPGETTLVDDHAERRPHGLQQHPDRL